MRNPIIRSTIIVFAFWWFASILWGLSRYGLPDSGLFLLTAIKSFVWGTLAFSLTIFVSAVLRWARKGWHLPNEERGIHCTIGLVPGVIRWPRRRKSLRVDVTCWPRVARWMTEGQTEYVKAFQAILDVMSAQPAFPASPTKGGHGDATLLEHSLNVAETGLELMPAWRFRPKNRDIDLQGRALAPQDRDIAMLILIGHDIGKLEAFKVKGDSVSIVKRFHDREGGRILATLKEIWSLPEDDRKALIAAVTHEHHPQDLPIHTGDTVRLLLEFLIDADTEAGRREEGRAKTKMEEVDDTNSESDDLIWEWFLDYIAKPGTINGREQRFRAGFKGADGLLYLNEQVVRTVFAEQFFKNPLQAEIKKGDGRYLITEDLLRILDARGVLICEFDGQRFKYKNALFKVVSNNSQGRILGEWQVAFVVSLGEHTPLGIQALAPAPNPPRITQALYGTRALRSISEKDETTHEVADEAKHSDLEIVPNTLVETSPSFAATTTSERPSSPPPDPYAHLGGLGKALICGMKKAGYEPEFNSNGRLMLSASQASKLSKEGGIDHKGYFDAFLKAVKDNETIMRGVEVVRDESELLQSVSIWLDRYDVPADTDSIPAISSESSDITSDPVHSPAIISPIVHIADADSPSDVSTEINAVPHESLSEPPLVVVTASLSAKPAISDSLEIEGLDDFEFGGDKLERLNEKLKSAKKNRNRRQTKNTSPLIENIVTQLNDRRF